MTKIRLIRAEFYLRGKNYEEATSLYKKVLRKEGLNKGRMAYNAKEAGRIHFKLAGIYADKGMFDKALDEYVKAFTEDPAISGPVLIPAATRDDCRRLGVAFLEAGVWDRAIDYFVRMKGFVPDGERGSDYMRIAEEMKKKNPTVPSNDFYFSLGESYIAKGLLDEARLFFTKRILKYVKHMDLLDYLNRNYNTVAKAGIKRKVWGDDIYIVLEDFEDRSVPVFVDGPRDTEPEIRTHNISHRVSRKGEHSEYFDLSYAVGGHYDYWCKSVTILLREKDMEWGLRLFLKNEEGFKGDIRLALSYPKSAAGGIIHTGQKAGPYSDWQGLDMDDIFNRAKDNAVKMGWKADEIIIDAVIVNTDAVSSRFYIDDIELYLK